ncbi:hypothetical protein T4B_1854 [Trichinella pseudospiralis]|uniref:Uncharacterized protein n=1 Tax=Trichinella pseudospiralis TaxID=6337 RepID=A0A0V1G970_TRIPS|nr:hypothetical protein T4B_1854 [Trichinella pseudospiralis]
MSILPLYIIKYISRNLEKTELLNSMGSNFSKHQNFLI